jgi:serine/threonine protein kinase
MCTNVYGARTYVHSCYTKVLEYLPGGDLLSLVQEMGCLHEDVVRQYLAEVVLALIQLHG